MEAIVGGAVAQDARRWIWELSLGNALFVRELVLGALGSGAFSQARGLWRMSIRPPVSASLAELITARMAGLSDPERRALELLALGEPLPLADVAALAGSEPLAAAEAGWSASTVPRPPPACAWHTRSTAKRLLPPFRAGSGAPAAGEEPNLRRWRRRRDPSGDGALVRRPIMGA